MPVLSLDITYANTCYGECQSNITCSLLFNLKENTIFSINLKGCIVLAFLPFKMQ